MVVLWRCVSEEKKGRKRKVERKRKMKGEEGKRRCETDDVCKLTNLEKMKCVYYAWIVMTRQDELNVNQAMYSCILSILLGVKPGQATTMGQVLDGGRGEKGK